MNNRDEIRTRVDEYIETQSRLDLLRFITCGSVDDGKSTLIGRMLFEAQLIFEDQITTLRNDSKKSGTQGENIDYALLVDGLEAEREQGITIDVAYRFFNTDKRKFIVADTPGHEQYTRNMATGASTADVAIILVDATNGILPQTTRHSFIASLLGIKHVVLAINKMDLVSYGKDTFDQIHSDYAKLEKFFSFRSITAIPLSALVGDNVVERSANMTWYQGPTILGFLESVEISEEIEQQPFRFPVQWVNRPNSNFRGFSGTIASGTVSSGDKILALPSRQTATVKDIILFDTKLPTAGTHKAITITLEEEIDLSRGDIIVSQTQPSPIANQFEVNLVWMSEEPGYVGRTYLIQIANQSARATITNIKHKYNINTFEKLPSKELNLNDIAVTTIVLDTSIPFEAYRECRKLGAFVFIDRYTNHTVGAGMINFALRRSTNLYDQHSVVTRPIREQLNAHKGRVFWLTGLSGSGKSTIASAAEKILHDEGIRTYLLDGDNIRQHLSSDLGFTAADRIENIRRIAEIARLMLDAGLVVITAFISPFRAERDTARGLFKQDDFFEIHIDTPIEIAEERDTKGLYKKARSGSLPNFTGIDSPYEPPLEPELRLDTANKTVDACVQSLVAMIRKEVILESS